jgi:hypothetical protein
MSIRQALQKEINESKKWLDRETMKVLTNEILKKELN